MDDYQQFIFTSKYARYNEILKRRETWKECIKRYIDFWQGRKIVSTQVLEELEDYILHMQVMPSMRALTSAGKALEEHNVAGYNCAFVGIDTQIRFSEIVYILMCGTGVGFSVEDKFIKNLPEVPEDLYETDTTIVVRDSKIGWAKAYKELISLLYGGQIPSWDVSKVRAKGERLKTFGGRASGPEPLVSLFDFTCKCFSGARGRKLKSIEVHDIICKIADIVVVGGVRRSALISLSDPNDRDMQHAKSGRWFETHPFRSFANNSVCYNELPSLYQFLKEWSNLYESGSGERGIFSRKNAKTHLAKHVSRRDVDWDWGSNPCNEIILRPAQFCNLTEVIVRPEDTFEDLKQKVEAATILGTLQSTLTNFKFLSKTWKVNCEEERLLGVSLTGIMDHPVLSNSYDTDGFEKWPDTNLENILQELKKHAIETNKIWAAAIGIGESKAITCVKPSGTVSQLCDTSSGIHSRFSEYYIRRVRMDKKDPLTKFLMDQGVPYEDCIVKPNDLVIFSFPQKSPFEILEMSAIDQLELWKIYAENWCEHKPSMTIYYTDKDFLEAGSWIYKNFNVVSGISFLPKVDHSYKQPPYEAITKDEYNLLVDNFPKIAWENFYEEEDIRQSVGEFACTSDKCIVDYL